jgi:drug/metabolite transporter (DMT)-like permease
MLIALRSNNFYPFFLLFLLGFTWGTSFSIAKFAMGSGVTPLGYAFWQSLGPAILVLLVSVIQSRSLPKFNKQHLFFYFICGLLGIALPNLTMYFSAVNVPSGILGLIVNTSPIITYFLAIFFKIEQFTWFRFNGIVFGFIGLFILFFPKLSNYTQFYWMIFAFLTPILLASCTVFMVKLRPQESTSLALSAGMLIAASCLISPLVFLNRSFHPIYFPLSTPDLFILIEIVLSSIGYILFFELLRVAGPVFYSLVGCIVALAGLFWGYIIFNETIQLHECISVIFIITAIIFVSKK